MDNLLSVLLKIAKDLKKKIWRTVTETTKTNNLYISLLQIRIQNDSSDPDPIKQLKKIIMLWKRSKVFGEIKKISV